MSRAIYAFSGDPITYGHIDLIERASRMFKELVVGVGINPAKKYLFSLEERTQIVADALRHLPNIRLMSFRGMLTDFAYEQQIPVIIRGLRNADDFNSEMMLYQINHHQKLGIDTVLIPTQSHLSHISSGAAKAIQLEQGDVRRYVPLHVKQQLEWRISGQLLLGVTGGIAAGKSTFCRDFENTFGMPAHHLDMDEIGREILFSSHNPAHQELRESLNRVLGNEATAPLDPRIVSTGVFTDKKLLTSFNQLMEVPFQVHLRKKLYGLRGIILIESALFAEFNLLDIVNNNLVLIGCDKDTQAARLRDRGYDEQKIRLKQDLQWPIAGKAQAIRAAIDSAGHGQLFTIMPGGDNTGEIKSWLERMTKA